MDIIRLRLLRQRHSFFVVGESFLEIGGGQQITLGSEIDDEVLFFRFHRGIQLQLIIKESLLRRTNLQQSPTGCHT